MSKILKNTTLSDIELDALGWEIPASGQTTVPEEKYLLLSSEDSITELTPLINSGDVVVNDGTQDLAASEGIAYLKYPDNAANIRFIPTAIILEDNVQDAIAAGVSTALNTPRFSIPLIYNGTVSNNEFIGYSNLIPGDDTPIVVPIDCFLEEYTFSNKNSSADFAIELRKNSTTGTVFNTETRTNTKNFVSTFINESFNQGDTIFVKYLDQGTNAQDVGLVLIFRAV